MADEPTLVEPAAEAATTIEEVPSPATGAVLEAAPATDGSQTQTATDPPKNWDAERQKLDQERATFRKEKAAEQARIDAEVVRLKHLAEQQPQTRQSQDDLAQLEREADEAASEMDPAKQKEVLRKMIGLIDRGRKETVAMANAQRTMNEEAAKDAAFWARFKDPDIKAAEAKALRDESYLKAQAEGYDTQKSIEIRMRELYNREMDSLRKSRKQPASQTPPPTAPKSGASATATTRVIPTTVARPANSRTAVDIGKRLAQALRGPNTRR